MIRLEIANIGEPIQVFTADVVSGMMRTDGTPVIAQSTNVHVVKEGDAEIDPNKEAAPAPPSLTNPGDTVGVDQGQKSTGTMRPVQPPKPNPEYEPDVNPDNPQPAAPAPAPPATTQPASTQPVAPAQPPAPAQPSNTPQPSQPPSSTPSGTS